MKEGKKQKKEKLLWPINLFRITVFSDVMPKIRTYATRAYMVYILEIYILVYLILAIRKKPL